METTQKTQSLSIIVAQQEHRIDLPGELLHGAIPVLEKMDADMDNGWKLSREFVENPNILQRCQIAANRLLTGLHSENESSVLLMAAYIRSRMPQTRSVIINHEGEDDQTLFYDAQGKPIV